ncbi:hypothetical protein QQ056_19445 [Oscillatoria laete-virens NRMC-F 0139]|nr:hypothetical protein [Oscillatoria laete-virens]MDL5055707.1 hypothetical protein [Oscillatoria laete-virens NRMC-F 0139]
MKEPNERILIYEGELVLQANGSAEKGIGSVFLDWSPTPNYRFKMSSGNIMFPLEAATLSCPIWNTAANVLVTNSGSNGISGVVSQSFSTGPSHKLKYIQFHIPNFIESFGSAIKSQDLCWRGRLHFDLPQWKITIDSLCNENELQRKLKALGGYAITHTGRIHKSDEACFSFSEAHEILNALQQYITFCRGNMTSLILLVGFDEQGSECWKQWSPYKLNMWKTQNNWFDPFIDPAPGFALFFQTWLSPTWKEPIAWAISWYVESYDQPLNSDKGIILIQAALELLAWTKLVDSGSLTENEFNRLRAADKMRQLLDSFRIPTAIPSSAIELKTIAQNEQWIDGPHAFTGIRNSLVHANPQKRARLAGINSRARYDAWNLGMWYIEMIILAIIGYQGKYGNRTTERWIGQTETTPWTP